MTIKNHNSRAGIDTQYRTNALWAAIAIHQVPATKIRYKSGHILPNRIYKPSKLI